MKHLMFAELDAAIAAACEGRARDCTALRTLEELREVGRAHADADDVIGSFAPRALTFTSAQLAEAIEEVRCDRAAARVLERARALVERAEQARAAEPARFVTERALALVLYAAQSSKPGHVDDGLVSLIENAHAFALLPEDVAAIERTRELFGELVERSDKLQRPSAPWTPRQSWATI